MSDAPQQRPPPQNQQASTGWLPADETLVFEGFSTLNTQSSRPAIEDDEMSWCNGFMPIGKNYARTLWGVGTPIFNASSEAGAGVTVVLFNFINIVFTPYCIAILSDGSIWAITTPIPGFGISLTVTKIAAAGTITALSQGNLSINQWGNQYALIVAAQADGYFIWDGTTFYGPGSTLPFVTGPVVEMAVTSGHGGAGYAAGDTGTVTTYSGDADYTVTSESGGVVQTVEISSPGSAYSNSTGNATAPGGAQPGSGSGLEVDIVVPGGSIPTGIGGGDVTTYQSRVWIIDGALVWFTAPGALADFVTADGGGSFTSSSPVLRAQYVRTISTNGFLYFVGDSSLDYISGVTTTGSPAVTSFTLQNADPEIGTPWSDSAEVVGRNIVYANSFGVFISYGGAVTKISEQLDGIYASQQIFGVLQPSACKAILFGRRCYLMLYRVTDPTTGDAAQLLMVWDGKRWFTTLQDVTLKFVASQEFYSVITAYGTDGNQIWPLFQQPSTAFTKTIQSRLWNRPGDLPILKTANRLWGAVQYNATSDPDLTVSIDSENGSADYTIAPGMPTVGQIYTFPGTAISQVGVYLGMTISTNAGDASLIEAAMSVTPWQYLG